VLMAFTTLAAKVMSGRPAKGKFVDDQKTEFQNNLHVVPMDKGYAMPVRVSANTAQRVPSSQLNKLARRDALWSEHRYPRGSEIFGEAEPADYVYQIQQGAVQTYKLLSDGRRQIGAFLLRGDIFGVEDCEVHRFTAEAIVDTALRIAKRRRLFPKVANDDIPAANNIRHLVTRTLENVENHLLLLGRQTALEKVATFLLEIDRRLEQPEVMVLPMERQSIADYLGITFETVCRVLSSLQKERILSLTEPRHRGIVLHDRSKLAQRDGRRIVSPKPSGS